MPVNQAPAARAADRARSVQLTCHPGTRGTAVHGVLAKVRVTPDGAIALSYLLEADLSRLRIPARGAGGRVAGLWQHTCFEAFVGARGAPGYREFNFAPSGDWAIHAFSRYREGMPVTSAHGPEIAVRGGGNRLKLEVVLRREHLPEDHPGAGWRIALSAVIEDDSGALSYWALKHPPGKPDFHHPDGFALELRPPLPFGAIGAAEGGQA